MKIDSFTKFIVGGIATIVILSLLIAFTLTIVPAGYVAIQYTPNGGVKNDVLTQGWHFISPIDTATLYTIGIEQSYLTKGNKGDSNSDESFSASSSEGKALQIDLTYTYQFQSETVAQVFSRFKGQSGTEIRDSFIKPNIVSWSKEVIARYKVSDVLGERRSEINKALTEYLIDKFKPYHIAIDNVSLINIEVDNDTREAINKKIKAQQDAETQKIQNETNIAKAKADAEVEQTNATAKAKAKKIEAEAEAKANKDVARSITKELVDYELAKARQKHGWVTVTGTNTVVTDAKGNK